MHLFIKGQNLRKRVFYSLGVDGSCMQLLKGNTRLEIKTIDILLPSLSIFAHSAGNL